MRYTIIPAAIFLLAHVVTGQDSSPTAGVTVRGTVHDASGAAIPKVKLKLGKESDETHKATAQEGSFVFEHVPPGNYVLTADAKGFEASEQKLKVGSKPVDNIDIQLEIAAAAESVTVSGSRKKIDESVNADRNADQLNFEKETLEGLPTPDQNPLALIGNFTSKASQGTEGLNVLVDGVEMDVSSLPSRAIRRVRVNHNPYSVRFRRPGKGRVEVLTEEGSMRRLRGGFSYYARNSIFDARNAFAATKPDLDRRMFEGNFSAPIVKQKATFFVTAEHLIDNETAVVNALTVNGPFLANVPAPDQRTSVLARFDVKKSETNTIYALYTFRDESQNNRGVGGFRLPETGIPEMQRQNRVQLSDNAILSTRFVNEVRLSFDAQERSLGRPSADPTIVVNGAFTGGGPQSFRSRDENGFRIQDVGTFYAGKHSILFGAEIHPAWYSALDRSNFAGTFQFASLPDYAASRPFVFSRDLGNPAVSFLQNEAFGFVQDEIRALPSLTVTPGLRYGWQSDVAHGNNFAPRLSFAYALPDRKTVIRGGAGIFYERVSEEIMRDSLLYDGLRIRPVVIANPPFPDLPATLLPATPPSVIRAAPGLRLPYISQASVAVERGLWKRTILTVEYQTTRGLHMLRSRDINAPLPSLGVRPDAQFINIDQVESTGSLRGNALTVTWRGSVRKWFTGMAQYTLSKTDDNTDGPFFLPANNFDFGPEWGRSDFDQRHRFNLAGTADLPKAFRLGVFVTLGSNIPFNITTGHDNNGDTLANDRPLGVTRNTGIGPGVAQLDLRFTKLLKAPRLFDRGKEHTSRNLEFSVDGFNILNHVNFPNFVGVLTSPFFGRANSALPGRTIQMSVRYKL